jgi:hypothetical protein
LAALQLKKEGAAIVVFPSRILGKKMIPPLTVDLRQSDIEKSGLVMFLSTWLTVKF